MSMSLFSRSIHLIFGRPLGRVPVTFILSVLLVMWVSFLRTTCPYHDSRFCVRTDFIGVTFAIPLMVSFLILSFLDFTLAFLCRWDVNAVLLACVVPSLTPVHHRRSDNCFVQLAFQLHTYLLIIDNSN